MKSDDFYCSLLLLVVAVVVVDEVEDDVDEVAPLDSPSHFHNCHTHHSRLECCADDAGNVVGVAHEDALCSPDFYYKKKSVNKVTI